MKKKKNIISAYLEISKLGSVEKLTYEQLRERVLKHSGEDLKPEVVKAKLIQVKKEMRELEKSTTPSIKNLLEPFTI